MAERPPHSPKQTCQEEESPQRSNSAPQPYEETAIVPQKIHVKQLPIYEKAKKSVNFICTFLDGTAKGTMDMLKFLACVHSLILVTHKYHLFQSLDLFCWSYNVVGKIKELMEEECANDHLQLLLWQKAISAIDRLSFFQEVLHGKEKLLLQTCLRTVLSFKLNAADSSQRLSATDTHNVTLKSLDKMMEKLVGIIPLTRLNQELPDIAQTLLNFTSSETSAVRQRALGRIRKLINLLNSPRMQVPTEESRSTDSPVFWEELQIPILGQLLGHLSVFPYSSTWEEHLTLKALCCLIKFIRKQRSRSMASNEGQQIQEDFDVASAMGLGSIRDVPTSFARYLDAVEKTDVICVAIKAQRESSVFNKEAARNVLDVAMRAPECWLVDVPNVIRCIHENIEGITTESAQKSMEALLLYTIKHRVAEAVSTIMEIAPPRDSSSMLMWELVFSMPETAGRVVTELFSWINGERHQSPENVNQSLEIFPLLALACNNVENVNFKEKYAVWRQLRHPNPVLCPLVLQGFVTLSQRAEMARRMKVVLPDVTESLKHRNADVVTKALAILQNVTGHLKKKDVSSVAVLLVEKLLPLFHHEQSQVREEAITFFTQQLKRVKWIHRRQIKEKVRTALFPLVVCMRDETPSVAEAAKEGLLSVAEFLGLRQPNSHMQTKLLWIVTDLLKQDKRKAEVYVNQSLQYIYSPEEAVRETAVIFLELAAEPLKNKKPQKISDICRGLEPLRRDASPAIREITERAVLVLTPEERNRETQSRLRRILCCWH